MANFSLPFVSVIVPAYNSGTFIADCINSLLKLDYPEDSTEIIIVDNASKDDTAIIIKDYPVRYFNEVKRGVSFARNKGILNSCGDIIAFTDADCLVSKTWLKELVLSFINDEVGGAAGEIVSFPPKTPIEMYAARTRHLSPQIYLNRPHLPFAVFANLTFRRKVFNKIGLLDERFIRAGESTDFCTRFFRDTDLKLEYAPKALVFHRNRNRIFDFVNQQWNYGRSDALLYIKYQNEVKWDLNKGFRSYIELIQTFSLLLINLIQVKIPGRKTDDLYLYYFDFLKKLAVKLGFIRESLGRGYLYF